MDAHRAPLALAYAAFAGGAPSSWRAAVTAACAWWVSALGRRPEPLQTTCAAVLVLGGVAPSEAVRPAFLLSVAAAVAIVSIDAESATTARTFATWIKSALRVSVRATLATAPIVLWCFGTLPVVGVLANVVLLPFGSVLLVQLSALHAVVAVSTPFGELTGALFATTSRAFLVAADLMGSALPSLRVPPLDRGQVLALTCACAAALALRRLRTRIVVCTLCVACIALLEVRLRAVEAPRGVLRASFLDVGQGDATLLDLPDGRLMLIDAGGSIGGGPDPGRAVLLPLLAARRRARIDILVITHPHPDHYGGVGALLDSVAIGEIWDNGQADAEAELDPTMAEAAALIRRARAKGIPIRSPRELCDRPLRAHAASVRVLWPCPHHEPGYAPNDNSLVLQLRFGKHGLLFAGDAESMAEARLVHLGADIRADLLKVGHHGSRTSSTPAFLRAVRPKLGILSAGAGNRYGHPHQEVVERLAALGVAPINLAVRGGAQATSDGIRLEVRAWDGWKRDLP